MTRFRLLPALLACAAWLAPALTYSQETTVTEKIDVGEVLLDVVVTDSSGNVILGLGPEDFVVEEGGEPIRLKSATFYSNRRFLEESGLAADEATPVDRYFILFFHDDPGLPAVVLRERQEAIRQAKNWVKGELLPNDFVAVVSYRFKLQVYQDFTTNLAEIEKALDNLMARKDPGDNWPSRMDDAGPSLRHQLPQGKQLMKATTRIYSGLEVLARAAGSVRGRKNLILVSPGFGVEDAFGLFVPDKRFFGRTVETLNDNNVAVYGISLLQNIDVRGPALGSPDNALSALAAETGGRAYFTFANYRTPFDSTAADNNGYYLLSYDARVGPGESGYREVTIRTKNREFEVRGRRGYRVRSSDGD